MAPGEIGRTLMIVGGAILFVGAILYLSGRGLPLGNLPGDIHIRRPGLDIYIPITTGILLSLVLTLVLNLFFRR